MKYRRFLTHLLEKCLLNTFYNTFIIKLINLIVSVVNPVPSGLERPKTLLPSFRDTPPSPAMVAPHSGPVAGAGTRETV